MPKLGIIREGKVPSDRRAPLSPQQCLHVMQQYLDVEIVVQQSSIRTFADEEYRERGIAVVENLHDCDIIMGVKEVNVEDLIPHKHFFFFSHTLKKQPYNQKLLQAIIAHHIQLTDYEALTDARGNRILGFGRYAGIVGCYNAFLTYGLKHSLYQLKPAHQCKDRDEMEAELSKIKLPPHFKLVMTGQGRVAHGALEILEKLPIKSISAEQFLNNQQINEPVYTSLSIADHTQRNDGKPFNETKFLANGEHHYSTFPRFLKAADLYVACHFWKSGDPYLFTRDDLKSNDIRLSVVADISCDIDGPVASTIRPSTIAEPIYGYHPRTEQEIDFKNPEAIAVMAVDNLPCELPRDSSQDFGRELINKVLPHLFGDDPHRIIERGSETTKDGKLTQQFEYLGDYLAGG